MLYPIANQVQNEAVRPLDQQTKQDNESTIQKSHLSNITKHASNSIHSGRSRHSQHRGVAIQACPILGSIGPLMLI